MYVSIRIIPCAAITISGSHFSLVIRRWSGLRHCSGDLSGNELFVESGDIP